MMTPPTANINTTSEKNAYVPEVTPEAPPENLVSMPINGNYNISY